MLGATYLFSQAVGDGVLVLRYLGCGVEGGSSIIKGRAEAMYVRGTSGLCTGVVLAVVVRGGDFNASFALIVA